MFRRDRLADIKPGRQFRPHVVGMMISTARVLTIDPDPYGIPHVHFEITIAPPSGHNALHDTRILSLERFAALYPDRVPERETAVA
jgi:hypothetical protein